MTLSLAAQVTSTGIVAPDYADVLQQLKIAFWSIYGSDANLDDDSQDGQLLAVFASAINDCNLTAVAVYNQFSPSTAQGVGLSSIVKTNGLARKAPSQSTVVVTIEGVAGTTITNGVVGDAFGNRWDLPASVTIPVSGTIDVTATAEDEGDIAASTSTVETILTPTLGWQSVTNADTAAQGQPVETDAELRLRQSGSTSLPAQSVLDGIFAAVANLGGVGRTLVYENDTDSTDANGIPSHSISVIAEGGDATEIAEAIAAKKPPGTGTYGSVSTVVIDDMGVPNTIEYYPLSSVEITVEITIKALVGYSSAIGEELVETVAAFVSALGIGTDSYLSRLTGAAGLGGIGNGATYYVTLVRQSRTPAGVTAANVAIAFNEAATCDPDVDVTLIVT